MKLYDHDDVLVKAMRVFWAKGYEATSMQDLVDGMGINRFSIYAGFGSKRKLYVAVLEKYCEQVIEARMRGLETGGEGLDDLRRYLISYMESIQQQMKKPAAPKGCLMAMTGSDPAAIRDPNVAARVAAHLRRMARAYRAVLQRAAERREIAADADLDAYAIYLVGCNHGLDAIAKSLSRKELEDYVEVAVSRLR